MSAVPQGRPGPVLAVSNIEVIYDHVILVLKGVSLEVQEGQIVALLGANGAGKTTTLKAISGLLKAEEGEVTDGSIEFLGGRIDQFGRPINEATQGNLSPRWGNVRPFAMTEADRSANGVYHDQVLWTILDEDWRRSKTVWGVRVH